MLTNISTTGQRTGALRAARLMIAAAGCLLAALLSAPAPGAGRLQPYDTGGPAPGFELPDTSGDLHDLADYRGKVVLVNFWASWCTPCLKEMPSLQRLQALRADRPFSILAVNVGEKRYKVWKFARVLDLSLPALLDERSQIFAAWEASVLPTSFLIDSEGRIRYRAQGDLEWDNPEVVALIDALLAETEHAGD